MATATKARPTSKATQNGHLTKNDEYRRIVGKEMADATADLADAQREFNDADSERKAKKKAVEVAQDRVNRVSREIRDIELGQYQPKMFDRPRAPSKASSNGKGDKKKSGEASERPAGELPPDAGAALTITELKNFGLTEKEVEKVENCPCHPKTIGEFEAWMKSDELWMTKIRGMKKAGIDKITDAYTALRQQYPFPTEDDRKTPTDGSSTIARNADGGESCAAVDLRRTKQLKDKAGSVTVAISLVTSPDGNSYRSCTSYTVGKASGGREMPRIDSQPHASRSEAGRAALTDLIAEFDGAGGKRKQIAAQIKQWRDRDWKDGGKIESAESEAPVAESSESPTPADAATDAPTE